MGAYIAQSDVENVYGVSNVAKWAQIDDTTVTATQVGLAIAFAEAHVNDRLRDSRYAVPLVMNSSAAFNNVVATIAGWWLFQQRAASEEIESRVGMDTKFEWAEAQLDHYVTGQQVLDASLVKSMPTAPVAI